MAKGRGISQGAAWALVVIAIVALALYGYNEYYRPAEAVPDKDTYDTVTISISDERSGESVDGTVQLKGSGYSIKKSTTGGGAQFTGVPKGSYTVTIENASYYKLIATQKIESKDADVAYNYTLDNIGTFSWGETSATISLNKTENQVATFNVYLKNTTKDTVLNSVRLKLVITENTTDAGHSIADVDSTTHALETDDETALKWIIEGPEIGAIEGLDTVTVIWSIDVDTNWENAGKSFDAVFSMYDLDGTSSKVTATKAVVATAS